MLQPHIISITIFAFSCRNVSFPKETNPRANAEFLGEHKSFANLNISLYEGQQKCLDSWFKLPGETRRILSVNPTYDWTCFSYALLNVSPMQVESSPPMPCPEPCHEIKTCSQCLSSRGSDGGWQRCVWSMALQQVTFS